MKTSKFEKAGELMWLFGLVFVALGVAICSKANLGVSMIAAPTFVIHEALENISSFFSLGVTEYLFQGITLILLCIIVQRFNWRYLLAFAVAVLYGYLLDLWVLILGSDPFEGVALRWVMLIIGDTCTAFGVACFFRTYMPLEAPELVVSEISDRYKRDIGIVKWGIDFIYLFTSFGLALELFRDVDKFDWRTIWYSNFHSMGLGTIVTTIINAPIIAIWGKLLDKLFDYKPVFPKMYKVLGREKGENNKETIDSVE